MLYLYKMKRYSKKECCKQFRYVRFKGTMTKWPVQKPTHRTTQKHVWHHDTFKYVWNDCFLKPPLLSSVGRAWGSWSGVVGLSHTGVDQFGYGSVIPHNWFIYGNSQPLTSTWVGTGEHRSACYGTDNYDLTVRPLN